MVSFEEKGLGPPGASRAARSSGAASHTPGPWSLDYRAWNGNARGDNAFEVSGLGWGGFAKVVIRLEDDLAQHPEGVANARLIAAAPDLLAALIAMEAEKSDYMRINQLGDPAREHTNRMAREAISKATGQEFTVSGDGSSRTATKERSGMNPE